MKQKLREEILSRDGYICQSCGGIGGLELHHIVPKLYGGTDSSFNLTTLCKKCHDQCDRKIISIPPNIPIQIDLGDYLIAIEKSHKKPYQYRKVVQIGDSMGVTLPPDSGFKLGDYVKGFFKVGKKDVRVTEANGDDSS